VRWEERFANNTRPDSPTRAPTPSQRAQSCPRRRPPRVVTPRRAAQRDGTANTHALHFTTSARGRPRAPSSVPRRASRGGRGPREHGLDLLDAVHHLSPRPPRHHRRHLRAPRGGCGEPSRAPRLPPPPSRTDWTHLVPPSVLTGHGCTVTSERAPGRRAGPGGAVRACSQRSGAALSTRRIAFSSRACSAAVHARAAGRAPAPPWPGTPSPSLPAPACPARGCSVARCLASLASRTRRANSATGILPASAPPGALPAAVPPPPRAPGADTLSGALAAASAPAALPTPAAHAACGAAPLRFSAALLAMQSSSVRVPTCSATCLAPAAPPVRRQLRANRHPTRGLRECGAHPRPTVDAAARVQPDGPHQLRLLRRAPRSTDLPRPRPPSAPRGRAQAGTHRTPPPRPAQRGPARALVIPRPTAPPPLLLPPPPPPSCAPRLTASIAAMAGASRAAPSAAGAGARRSLRDGPASAGTRRAACQHARSCPR